MKTTYFVMASLIGLAYLMMVSPAFAQEIPEYLPLDVQATITSIEREHGIFVDRWTIEAEITNTGSETAWLDLGTIVAADSVVKNDCGSEFGQKTRAGATRTLTGCYTINSEDEPDYMSIYGFIETFRVAAIPFERGACDWVLEGVRCLPLQDIGPLTIDIESEPVQCEMPDMSAVEAPAVAIQTDIPRIGSAAYHIYMKDIILTFDTPVTLADDWHESISVQAETETGTVELDGLDARVHNIMPDGSTLVWLSLYYDDAKQLDGVTDMALRIGPGTFTYGDGDVLRTMLLPSVEVVP